MKDLILIDFMLNNEKTMYISLVIILLLFYYIFDKMKISGLYVLCIFIAIKIAIHTYLDDYIDSKKKLKKLKHAHIITITLIVSLLISFPAIIISKKIGIEE